MMKQYLDFLKEAKDAPEEAKVKEEAKRREQIRGRRRRPKWSEEKHTKEKPIRGEESDKYFIKVK